MTTVLLVLILPFLQASSGASKETRVLLRATAEVDGSHVRLLDLVQDDLLPSAWRSRLDRVYLGRTPRKGKTRKISAEDILLELERREIPVDFLLFVGEAVTVKRADVARLSAERRISGMISLDLRKQFGQTGFSNNARIIARVTQLSRNDFAADATLVSVEPREPLKMGAVAFVAEVASASKDIRMKVNGIVRFVCRFKASKTTRDLVRNHTIRMEDIQMDWIEEESTEGYCTDLQALIGGHVLQKLSRGEVLSSGLVKLRPVVQRRDQIRVMSDLVQFEGECLSAGTVGENIRVRIRSTKKVVVCRVLGPGRAEFVGGEK